MTDQLPHPTDIQTFIDRWLPSGGAERANYQSFLNELCDVLAVPRPDPTVVDDAHNAYVFERQVLFNNGDGSTSPGWIDLYRRGHFVLEAKQGTEKEAYREKPLALVKPKRKKKGTAVRGTKAWDDAMLAAKGRAEQYARALPITEGWPPFIITVDIGHSFEIYTDFTMSGREYLPFPDARSYRIPFRELGKPEYFERLGLIWTDPQVLDPTRRSAKITREIAAQLAALAKSLEVSGYTPERASSFLMRCIFTMFAEDVRLLPGASFTELLEGLRENVAIFPDMVQSLWQTMAEGSFSPILKKKLLRFNGGLFETAEALPVTEEQLELLLAASKADWRDVEPAIFGTLLERALNPLDRQKLGAHYTPRAYVERLVIPAVIEPLRDEWAAARAAGVTLAKSGNLREAVEEIKGFLRKLCNVHVLDPACGSGNFLYVTLEHMKRLEGEVLDTLESFGEKQVALEHTGLTIDPHQLLGIEINPRAAAIADLVLWIGYLQWHFRTRGNIMPPEPVLRKFHNIEHRDALLAYDRVEPVADEADQPVTRWDGRSYKKHPITGEDVPDETARESVLRYINPRKAKWPKADFIVGNPPFIGSKRMRELLGDGYIDALQEVMPEVPQATDFVLRWWHLAAEKARAGEVKRFGLITTNSINQSYNRRAIEPHLTSDNPLSIVFAIPNHPWVDSTDGAAVRVAMTAGEKGVHQGQLLKVVEERRQATDDSGDLVVLFKKEEGRINVDLTVGVDVTTASVLESNSGLCSVGIKTIGEGFVLSHEEAVALGLGTSPDVNAHIRPYLNGRDLASKPRGVYVLDLYGLSEADVRKRFPAIYQHLLMRVKPERELNRNKIFRENWWIIGHPRQVMRDFLKGLNRYIGTIETSKHRFFSFLSSEITPDSTIVTFGLEDAFFLGVLSSRIHVAWALAAGSRLGVGNDPRYNKTRCFEPYPFPICSDEQKASIRELGEMLDAHKKQQQIKYPNLTITDMYNVLEKVRVGETLTDKERALHDQGLVSVLRRMHDDLDALVLEAYGWPAEITDDEILQRLVALNAERAREEESGLVRWLRPAFQHPDSASQPSLDIGEGVTPVVVSPQKQGKRPWPKTLAEQAQAVRQTLTAQPGVVTAEQIAEQFMRGRPERIKRINELLQTLVSLGKAREVEKGKYAA